MVPSRRIADVAAEAGVSPTTVSHALSGRRPVAPATRARILNAVERLDYRPDRLATSLRTQRTQTLALIIPDIANPYYPASARALLDGVNDAGFMTLIANTDGDPEGERAALQEMVARRVDGIVMHSLATSTADLRRIVGPDLPVVVVGGLSGLIATDLVVTADSVGLGEAVKYLHGNGVRDLGFVDGPEGNGMYRLVAFLGAAHALGLNVQDDWIRHTPFTREGGFAAAMSLLHGDRRPAAIMCANDLIAIGVMDAARALNIRIPEDLAVIGFDDIETAALVTPQLTTITNPASLTGATCAELLLERIVLGADAPYVTRVLPTSLVLRESA
ncbi:MAG TPA: LacI family DNA-binding transcriptional regulator [Plantibacter sp.]|uniref:LacI family DNA-binding transcriptional regulator n=1 Tax=unclassified Plantibacter TaxID=2624265 RepID=UPI002D1C398F|nr:LacI family DNA-binding transcriptional regulator [Plantibacter sp.]